MQGLLALPVSEAPFSCSCTRSHLTGGSPWASEGPRAGRAPDPERSERPHQRDEEERFHYQGCPRGKHAPDWGDGLAQHAVPAARPSWHERALISVFRQASFFFANKPAADISCSSQGRVLLATKSSRDWRDLAEEHERIPKHTPAAPAAWGKQALRAHLYYSCKQQPPEAEPAEAALRLPHDAMPRSSRCGWRRRAAGGPGKQHRWGWLRPSPALAQPARHSPGKSPTPPCSLRQPRVARNSYQGGRNREHKLNKVLRFFLLLFLFFLLTRLTGAVNALTPNPYYWLNAAR